jgi:hypothetical protein
MSRKSSTFSIFRHRINPMSHEDMLQLFDFELRPYRSNDSIWSGRALARGQSDGTRRRSALPLQERQGHTKRLHHKYGVENEYHRGCGDRGNTGHPAIRERAHDVWPLGE